MKILGKIVSFEYEEKGKSVAFAELEDDEIAKVKEVAKLQGGLEVVDKNVKMPKVELPKPKEANEPVEWQTMKEQFIAEAKEMMRVEFEAKIPEIRKQVKAEIIAEATKGK